MIRLTFLISVLCSVTLFAQSPRNTDISKDSVSLESYSVTSKIVELDKVVNGFGPSGRFSRGIASRDMYDEGHEELNAYPDMKNIPDALIGYKEYRYPTNSFQFWYQNYKAGKFSKKYFYKMAEGNGYYLADTVNLSVKEVKNTIRVVAGYMPDSSLVYIVDKNNNGDFADDELKPLVEFPRKEKDVVDLSVMSHFEYYDGTSIKKDSILLLPIKSIFKPNDIDVSFIQPQFKYGKIKLNDEDYLIISEAGSSEKGSVFIFKDEPRFGDMGREESIEPGQFYNVNGTYLQYSSLSQNMNKVKLTINSTLSNEENSVPVSNQIGMQAPQISGVDINNDKKIALKDFKGKYVFLEFWSIACGPCFLEFPYLKKVHDNYSSEDIVVIGIADFRGDKNALDFLKEKDVTWPTIVEEHPTTVDEGYHLKIWPSSYLIDPSGKIIDANLRGNALENKLKALGIHKK